MGRWGQSDILFPVERLKQFRPLVYTLRALKSPIRHVRPAYVAGTHIECLRSLQSSVKTFFQMTDSSRGKLFGSSVRNPLWLIWMQNVRYCQSLNMPSLWRRYAR